MTLARISGAVYVVTFVSGTMALLVPAGRQFTNLVAAASYVAVTILFYFLFRPVNRLVSLTAAIVSLAGCIVSALAAMRVIAAPFNPLGLFGIYCLLIGYLVFSSTYLPRAIGVLMMVGGLGWLTFVVPAIASRLTPYNFAPGMIAEGTLTLWLLIAGVDVARWRAMSARRT